MIPMQSVIRCRPPDIARIRGLDPQRVVLVGSRTPTQVRAVDKMSGTCAPTDAIQLRRQFLDLRGELGDLVLARQVQPRDGLLHGRAYAGLELFARVLRLLEEVIDELFPLVL